MSNIVKASQMGAYLSNANVKNYLENILKERAGNFISSMASIASMNPTLQDCTAKSLMMCGLKAASMDLPIDPNLGYAYPVPYKNKGVLEAQFQMGYRGYVQLAMRTGQYRKLIVTDIREGEILEIDHITETYKFKANLDEYSREKSAITGYYTMFELINGFRKELYWPIEKILAHGQRYSKTYSYDSSRWKTDQDSMARKTLLRQIISKWGPMSIEMQEAYKADMSVIRYNEQSGIEEVEYPDNAGEVENTDPVQDSPLNENKSDQESLDLDGGHNES